MQYKQLRGWNPEMKMRFHLVWQTLVIISALASGTAAESNDSNAEALKERIIAHARTVTAEDHAYTRTIRTESTEGEKKQERTVVEKWDPSKPAEQRWNLISIDAKPPSAEQLASYRKDLPKRRQSYYGRVAGYFSKPATSSVDSRGRTVFRFESLPKETVMISDADISANATGEITVDTSGAIPFIEEVRFVTTKPTRVKLIAKIERLEATTRYRLMPDGKPVPMEAISDMSGSMLTQQGRIHTRITYSDQRAVGK